MKNVCCYNLFDEKIIIAEENGEITDISFWSETKGTQNETPIIAGAFEQLKEYFEGRRKTFDLPLNPKGTDFQKKVWQTLCDIPYGETRTYKQIAEQCGNSKASRAVGMANNKNPIGIVIPCHRVIGVNGALTGYAGGLDKKQKLLNLEKKHV